MLKKQKINIASRIIARGLLPLYRYFPERNVQEDFHYAQQNETVRIFFLKEFTHLPLERRKQLSEYYDLTNLHLNIGTERASEVLINPISDLEGFSKAESHGIISEYSFLKDEYKYYPQANQHKVLLLIEKEILLIRNNLELILSIDPDLSILKQFNELPNGRESNDELLSIIEKEDILELGTAVLRRLNPKDNGYLLDLPDEIKPILMQKFFKRITFYLRMDTDLSDTEKKHIINHSNLLLEYLSDSNESYDLAFSALAFEKLPSDFKQSPEYIGILWRLGSKYLDDNFNVTPDFEALLRLYHFLVKNVDKIKNAQGLDNKIDINTFQVTIHNQLGEIYEYFWEDDKAINQYKKVIQLGLKNQVSKSINGAIQKIIQCQINFFHKNAALQTILAALKNDAPYFEIEGVLEIESALRKTLDMQLLTLLDELDISKDRHRKKLAIF